MTHDELLIYVNENLKDVLEKKYDGKRLKSILKKDIDFNIEGITYRDVWFSDYNVNNWEIYLENSGSSERINISIPIVFEVGVKSINDARQLTEYQYIVEGAELKSSKDLYADITIISGLSEKDIEYLRKGGRDVNLDGWIFVSKFID